MPPWVGSGCSQIRVPAGAPLTGTESSPTSRRPSSVWKLTGVRVAGSTVAGLISVSRLNCLSS